MRIKVTFLVAIIVSIGAPVQLSALGLKSALNVKDRQAIKKALQLYGWSLPLCAYPIDRQVKPYCVTIARLIQRYPFHSRYIPQEIYSLAERRFALRGLPTRLPERIIEILTEHGTVAGCVPKGKSRGPITLGQLQTSISSARLDQMINGCDNDLSQLMPGKNFTLGVLVGGALDAAPLFSLDPATQVSYENYLDECNSQTAHNPRGTVAEGAATTETEETKKQREAAEHAREEAEKAQKEAEEAQNQAQEAQNKAEDAQEQADKVKNDPEATEQDKATAQADADKAAADAAIAQDKADELADRAAMREGDAERAERELNEQKKKDAFDAWYTDWVRQNTATGRDDPYERAARLFGAAIVRWAETGKLRTCLDESCALSCEAQARIKAARDQLLAQKNKPVCNLDVMPLPDDGKCYEAGFFKPQQSVVAQMLDTVCRQVQGIDGQCFQRFPEVFFKGRSWQLDPCHSPIAMCAPEEGTASRTGRLGAGPNPRNPDNKSVPLPAANRGPEGNMWTNPTFPARQ